MIPLDRIRHRAPFLTIENYLRFRLRRLVMGDVLVIRLNGVSIAIERVEVLSVDSPRLTIFVDGRRAATATASSYRATIEQALHLIQEIDLATPEPSPPAPPRKKRQPVQVERRAGEGDLDYARRLKQAGATYREVASQIGWSLSKTYTHIKQAKAR